MTGVFYYLKGKTEPWAGAAADEYVKKISYFFKFEKAAIKSKSEARDNADSKKRAEATSLLAKIEPQDFLILFDEAGKTFKNSREFSRELVRVIEGAYPRVVFTIGGPYGFDTSVQNRAQAKWSLSGLTMNHHIAQIAALEQIYRGLTIWKGLPYHN